jgi:hypothetical protein
MKFDAAYKHLRSLGIQISYCGSEYRVNRRGGHLNTERITDDLSEAIRIGEEMATHRPPLAPQPLGPMGKRTRRSEMYRHNRKIAAQRAKAERDG